MGWCGRCGSPTVSPAEPPRPHRLSRVRTQHGSQHSAAPSPAGVRRCPAGKRGDTARGVSHARLPRLLISELAGAFSSAHPLGSTALQAWADEPRGRYTDVQAGATRRYRRQLPMLGADVQSARQPVAARMWPNPHLRAREGLRLDVEDVSAPGRKHRSGLDHHPACRHPGHDYHRIC
eukprot:COSAG02_NODE_3406_length_6793_cov_7.881237_3_plen_178_part_00